MIIKKYRDFLLRENKEQNWKDKFESRLVYLKNKRGLELKDGVEDLLYKSDQETIDSLNYLNAKEEKPLLQDIIKNMESIESKYWNTSLSMFYCLVIYLLLFWNVKVDDGKKEMADDKLKEITGETVNKNSKIEPKNTKKDNVANLKDSAEKMNKQYKDNIEKLKAEINKERKLREKLEKNMKKYLDEKEKLEKEKKELEKKNKELKERERLKEITKRLNQIDVKIGLKTKD